tara:strand:- start:310 stop:543 length:234 start_codon:yes stop_codon:yes gene_type:complete
MEQKIKKKKKTPRCNYKDCRKKLKLTDFKCPACKLKFCNKHRYYSDHNCEKYEEYINSIKNNDNLNKKVVFDKVKDI